jgi:NhaA family Na+:H+ antiporter
MSFVISLSSGMKWRGVPPNSRNLQRMNNSSGNAHVTLMSRSETLTEDDLHAVAERLDLPRVNANVAQMIGERARRRVQADVDDARASGVRFTPTFFINGRRYDGPWDESSFTDAMLGSLGHRVRTGALTFAR